MKRIDHKSNMHESLEGLESALAGTLHRIRPPYDMVRRLRQRMQMPNREELASRLGDWRRLFVVFGGVMSGVLVIITVARALFHFLARRQTL